MENNNRELGLLPHEAHFVTHALSVAIEKRREAIQDYADAVNDSGGDWALDDPASIYTAQTAHIKDKSVQRLTELHYLSERIGLISYPDMNDERISFGSRVTVEINGQIKTYDIFTRIIPGFTIPEGISLVSNDSPLGNAIINKRVGDEVVWQSPDRKKEFKAMIISIDQQAQKKEYS